MSRFVVDASVAMKWLIPEPYTEAAEELLDPAHVLLAPDLLYAEIGNALWKRVGRRELHREEALPLLAILHQFPLNLTSMQVLADAALDLALELNCTVYDAAYLVLAVHDECRLVTADRRLQNAASRHGLGRHVAWLPSLN